MLFILCILILILLYIVKCYKIFDFDCKSKSIWTFIVLILIILSYIISLSTMSNLTKLNFMAFDIFERNYISWILDAKQIIDFLMKNHQ